MPPERQGWVRIERAALSDISGAMKTISAASKRTPKKNTTPAPPAKANTCFIELFISSDRMNVTSPIFAPGSMSAFLALR